MVPPVFPASEVEHYGFAQLLVLDQKSEGRHVHVFVPILDRFNEGLGRYDNIGGGIDNGNLHRRIGLGEFQGRVRLGFDVVACHDYRLCLNWRNRRQMFERQEAMSQT